MQILSQIGLNRAELWPKQEIDFLKIEMDMFLLFSLIFIINNGFVMVQTYIYIYVNSLKLIFHHILNMFGRFAPLPERCGY